MDVEPEKLAQSAARALADYTGCAAVATTPQAEDLCIAHFEVVQVGGIPPQFWRLPAPAVCAPVWRVSTPA